MFESLFGALCKIGTFFKLHFHNGDNIYNYQPNPEIERKSIFKNHLAEVARELPHNFRNRGNAQNPFITKALENLVYDEPMIHEDTELFQKASHCLNIALELSTAKPWHPTLKPGQGQYLMKDLAEYISIQYGIKSPNQN